MLAPDEPVDDAPRDDDVTETAIELFFGVTRLCDEDFVDTCAARVTAHSVPAMATLSVSKPTV